MKVEKIVCDGCGVTIEGEQDIVEMLMQRVRVNEKPRRGPKRREAVHERRDLCTECVALVEETLTAAAV